MDKARRQALADAYGAGQIKQALIAGEYPPPPVAEPECDAKGRPANVMRGTKRQPDPDRLNREAARRQPGSPADRYEALADRFHVKPRRPQSRLRWAGERLAETLFILALFIACFIIL